MKARGWNTWGALAVVAVAGMTGLASEAAPAPHSPGMRPAPRGAKVEMRTLLQYSQSAWLMPAAVVLESQEAWDEWNAAAVASGMAMGAETLPAVDWQNESVLVVAMGEDMNRTWLLELRDPRRHGSVTEITLVLETDYDTMEGISSNPCHVVALNKHAARSVKLVAPTGPMAAGLPSDVPLYGAAPMAGEPMSGLEAAPVPTTWGALKADYR